MKNNSFIVICVLPCFKYFKAFLNIIRMKLANKLVNKRGNIEMLYKQTSKDCPLETSFYGFRYNRNIVQVSIKILSF